MSGHQIAAIDDTVYFWFAGNDTSGTGGDGASPLFDVREAGAAASAIPLLSGTPTLLTHANYPAGCYEVSVAATTGNGFANNDVFSVFCTLAIDSQNPTGFIGSCSLRPVNCNIEEYRGTDVTGSLLTDRDVGLVFSSTVSTVTSQTEYDMADGISSADIWKGAPVLIWDVTGNEGAVRYVTSVDTVNDRIIVDSAPTFTVATSDEVRVFASQHPAYALGVTDPATGTQANLILDKLLGYVQLLARSDAAIITDRSTELGDINLDEGTGAGDYAPASDSIEAAEAATAVVDANVVLTLADTADMQPKLGTPVADLATDIAGVQTDTTAIELDTQDIQNRVPASLAAGGSIKSAVTHINDVTIIGDGAGTPFDV